MKKVTSKTVFTPFKNYLLYNLNCNDYVVGFYCSDSELFRCQYNHTAIPYEVTHYSELPKIKKPQKSKSKF